MTTMLWETGDGPGARARRSRITLFACARRAFHFRSALVGALIGGLAVSQIPRVMGFAPATATDIAAAVTKTPPPLRKAVREAIVSELKSRNKPISSDELRTLALRSARDLMPAPVPAPLVGTNTSQSEREWIAHADSRIEWVTSADLPFTEKDKQLQSQRNAAEFDYQ